MALGRLVPTKLTVWSMLAPDRDRGTCFLAARVTHN